MKIFPHHRAPVKSTRAESNIDRRLVAALKTAERIEQKIHVRAEIEQCRAALTLDPETARRVTREWDERCGEAAGRVVNLSRRLIRLILERTNWRPSKIGIPTRRSPAIRIDDEIWIVVLNEGFYPEHASLTRVDRSLLDIPRDRPSRQDRNLQRVRKNRPRVEI